MGTSCNNRVGPFKTKAAGVALVAMLCLLGLHFRSGNAIAQSQSIWYRSVVPSGGLANMSQWEQVPQMGSTNMNVRGMDGVSMIVRREGPSAVTIQITSGDHATSSAVDCAAPNMPRRAILQFQQTGQSAPVQLAIQCSANRPAADDLGAAGRGPVI